MVSIPHQDRLLSPVTLGALTLSNRVIMSPMSRVRADADLAPPDFVARYYAQRASAGLIITESTAVAPYGAGFPPLPGLFTARQVNGWRKVVEAVHDAGGPIAAQLWHTGRERKEDEAKGRPPGWAMMEAITPAELTTSEIAGIVKGYVNGARASREAGFDAIEIHNGNGFLLDRFLRAGTNGREDSYGGSLENRTRLTLEILAAVSDVYGAERVGIRFSPSATVAGSPDPRVEETFAYLLERLRPLGLAWVDVTRVTAQDLAHGSGPGIPLEWIRSHYAGRLIGAGEFDRETGEEAIAQGTLDAVAYGRLFLANPDLPKRFARRAPLNKPNPQTFYAPGETGLTDYPPMEAA
ncbi:alkene reductase [Archangium violaceum]|uniref:alkene reductase n=1 Tax=Archangium violaceum TaxID=83451 RepID=UPI002B30F1C0|nr:alkene reductase [Archangium violaceum]